MISQVTPQQLQLELITSQLINSTMEFEMSHLIWNLVLTLIVLPLAWWLRTTHEEIRRQDILLNKTREEIARDYVSKRELTEDMNRILDAIQKLNDKLDRIQEAANKEYRL